MEGFFLLKTVSRLNELISSKKVATGAVTPTVVFPSGNSVYGDIPNSWKNGSNSELSLSIGNSVTSIGTYAFQDCTGFTGALTIPSSVTSIGSYAFYNCSSLTGALTLPNSVTSLGSQAFRYCSGLTNVNCYVVKTVLDVSNSLLATSVTTIHARTTDTTWTASGGQTIGGKTGITVIKDL